MKKALTLIELIFTIVIIAAVFTVIPKIIYVSNKTLEFSKKEDAIFNMMSKIMDISLKEYDQQNTKYDDILLTGNNNVLECNTTTNYRIGGFAGSRNCKNAIYESNIPTNEDGEYDYIEGYNGVGEKVSYGHTNYDLNISVNYIKEWTKDDYKNNSLFYKFNKTGSDKRNIKRVLITISNNDSNISSVTYYSANIGHIIINSEQW